MMIEAVNGHVNIPDMSIYSLLQKNAEVNGSKPVIIFYDKYITYAKLLKYVDSMAFSSVGGNPVNAVNSAL